MKSSDKILSVLFGRGASIMFSQRKEKKEKRKRKRNQDGEKMEQEESSFATRIHASGIKTGKLFNSLGTHGSAVNPDPPTDIEKSSTTMIFDGSFEHDIEISGRPQWPEYVPTRVRKCPAR